MADRVYPLQWPRDVPRARERRPALFRSRSAEQVATELAAELRRFGATRVLVSSNLRLRKNGRYHAGRRAHDPGVAVFFRREGRPLVFACDTYEEPWQNIFGIVHTIRSLRAIERHGSAHMARCALAGFEVVAVPRPRPSAEAGDRWRRVLGVPGDARGQAALRAARRRYHELVQANHPDRGGDVAVFREVRAAMSAAVRELGAAPSSGR